MKKLLSKTLSLWCIAAAMCLASCIDDVNSSYPSRITEFVVAKTNSSGMLSKVILDDGRSYDVSSPEVNWGVADTLFRCLASYVPSETSIKLYGITNVFSNYPVSLEKILESGEYTEETLPRDPVKVVSMWKSGGYINMELGVLTTSNAPHRYAFCDEGDGKYSLLHEKPLGYPEAYTQSVFLSMPIPEGVESLTFSVHTYDGTFTHTF